MMFMSQFVTRRSSRSEFDPRYILEAWFTFTNSTGLSPVAIRHDKVEGFIKAPYKFRSEKFRSFIERQEYGLCVVVGAL